MTGVPYLPKKGLLTKSYESMMSVELSFFSQSILSFTASFLNKLTDSIPFFNCKNLSLFPPL
jgi:hypothetical protein